MNFIKLGRIFDQMVKPNCDECPDDITNLILDYAEGENLFVNKPTGVCLLNVKLKLKSKKTFPNQPEPELELSIVKKSVDIYYCECCARVFISDPKKHVNTKTHKKKCLLPTPKHINKHKVKTYFKNYFKNYPLYYFEYIIRYDILKYKVKIKKEYFDLSKTSSIYLGYNLFYAH